MMTDKQQIHSSDSNQVNSQILPSKKVTDSAPDVVLLCGQERISCHRAVLSEASPYFCAMFNSSFAEKDEPQITIKDVDGFLLRILVDLSYGYPLELENERMMLSLLETASMLQFLTVQKRCVEFLLHTLNGSNALQYFTVGDMIGVPELSRQSFAYLLYHFDSISESRELFSQLHAELLVKFLGHPNLSCESEVEILRVVNRWISDQSDNVSDERILQLFSCARFRVLTVQDLQTASALAFIRESKLLSKVMTAMSLKLEGDVTLKACQCYCHTSKGTSPKLKMEGCQACLLIGRADDETDVRPDRHPKAVTGKQQQACISTPSDCSLKRIFQNSCCTKKKETLIQTDDDEQVKVCFPPDIVALADELLSTSPRSPPFVPCVVGHLRKSDNPSEGPSLKKQKHVDGPTLLMFNTQTNEFQSLVKLSKVHEGPVEASGFQVCSLGKDVYIFGGEYMFGYSNWQNSVWRWDSFRDMWSIETSLLSSRRHHSLCVHEEFIYLVGGYGKHRIILDSVDRYSTSNCSWKRCAPLPSPLYSAAVCFYKGTLYVFSHQIFAYDPELDEWQTLENIRIPSDTTFSQALAVKNNGMYLTSVYSNLLYHFDPDSDSQEVCVVRGGFQNNVLNSCYIDSLKSIYTFCTAEANEAAGFPSVHQVEIFNVETKSFAVLWNQSTNQGIVHDFGIRHSLGCFSFLNYH